MNIPNLPTDNLYKFLALTGLFLLVASFGYKEYRNQLHNVENAEIIVGKEILKKNIENQVRLLEISQQQNISELNSIKTETDKAYDKNRELHRVELKKAYENLLEQADLEWYNSEGGKLRLKSELADISVDRTKSLNWILNLGMLIGLCSMISGFYLWYIKLQKFQDIILFNESKMSELKVSKAKETE